MIIFFSKIDLSREITRPTTRGPPKIIFFRFFISSAAAEPAHGHLLEAAWNFYFHKTFFPGSTSSYFETTYLGYQEIFIIKIIYFSCEEIKSLIWSSTRKPPKTLFMIFFPGPISNINMTICSPCLEINNIFIFNFTRMDKINFYGKKFFLGSTLNTIIIHYSAFPVNFYFIYWIKI